MKDDDIVIGYSAFHLYEEWYEYNENSCYIADTEKSIKKFIKRAMFNIDDYKIVPVKKNDILKDYGCSCGKFAMEPKSLKRLKKISGLSCQAKEYYEGDPYLFAVEID
ncbi:MAG: hypothetical protein OMM_10970 [Candidatus Magnetoglobus multicellularis str. Araruama]|uniref:Uncharacterized protein n=2 Tax=Candidatus Magnetoglobus multicellularis str. Araruama TaxID=890399 RepID=A0A1V1NZS7_9BACT|nr:MAG: hypothetical protein OMM_10970 [Candidatus Magnetoglobus multicellularis str. Araruama]